MGDQIIVVSAAIVNVAEKRLFVQRRSAKTSYAWHWCTPGGKATLSERYMHQTTLRRELFEEHHVFLKECQPLLKPVYLHEMTTETGEPMAVDCRFVLSDMIEGEYVASGPTVAGFDWVNANELETLMLGPADHANRGKLLDLIR